MAGSSDSSTGLDLAPFGLNERQEFRQEMMQMMMDLLNQHEHQWQLSQPPADPTNLTGRTGSTTSTDASAQATLKASEIGYFFPNMPLD